MYQTWSTVSYSAAPLAVATARLPAVPAIVRTWRTSELGRSVLSERNRSQTWPSKLLTPWSGWAIQSVFADCRPAKPVMLSDPIPLLVFDRRNSAPWPFRFIRKSPLTVPTQSWPSLSTRTA